MFEYRVLKFEDYSFLVECWEKMRFPPPPIECLPQNDNSFSGIMVSKAGQDICFGFLYFTNSKMVWIEFICRTFDYRESDSDAAQEFLILTLAETAKDYGYNVAYTSVKHPRLIQRYEAVGFSKGAINATEMVLKL